MIVPDVNLLIYAYDAGSRHHHRARAWWEGCLNGTESVGLAPVVLFGFVRLVTSPRVFASPMRVEEAAAHLRSWIGLPVVQLLQPGPRHVELALRWLEDLGTGGSLTTDAQIAAIATEHRAEVHTADSDFARFPGLRWFNPITGTRHGG